MSDFCTICGHYTCICINPTKDPLRKEVRKENRLLKAEIKKLRIALKKTKNRRDKYLQQRNSFQQHIQRLQVKIKRLEQSTIKKINYE